MTHPDHQRTAADGASQSDEAIERLLRFAGPRQAADTERARRVRAAVHDVWRGEIRRRGRLRWWTIGGAGLAAAAAVLITVSLARRDAGSTPSPRPDAPAARLVSAIGSIVVTGGSTTALGVGDAVPIGAQVETGAGVLATMLLTNGGEVRVNQGTVVHFTAARDLSIDRGAVYVDSGSRGGSLTVRTPLGVVRDVGTRFEVRLIDDIWRVRVRDGLVRYERGVTRQDADAGAELLVRPDGTLLKRPAAMFGAEWAWIVRAAPAFQVEGRTLAAFLDWVTRESGRRIEFA